MSIKNTFLAVSSAIALVVASTSSVLADIPAPYPYEPELSFFPQYGMGIIGLIIGIAIGLSLGLLIKMGRKGGKK